MRVRWSILSLVTALLVFGPAGVQAYNGSLSSDTGGLLGTGMWVDKNIAPPNQQALWYPASIVWTVNQNVDLTWHYDYSISVFRAAVSHAIFEASSDFTSKDIRNATGPFQSIAIQLWNPGPGNPFMPASMYGIKFDSTTGTVVTISFDSPRVPVWGDFYAKCGAVGGMQNTIWNAGFVSPDTDPMNPPSSGSLYHHILVPDTAVPEPSGLVAMAWALAASGLAVRRVSKRMR